MDCSIKQTTKPTNVIKKNTLLLHRKLIRNRTLDGCHDKFTLSDL